MPLYPSLRLAQTNPLPLIRRTQWSHLISRPQPRSPHSKRTLSAIHKHRTTTKTTSLPLANPLHPSPFLYKSIPHRTLTSQTANHKPDADNLVTELQDLYEVAKDEFEIATESTDGVTLYAASDRESARDALNQLLAVYRLYTSDQKEKPHSVVTEGQAEAEGAGEGRIVEMKYDPAQIEQRVRDEVRKRVGQRVRELENAVEVLEEKGKAD